jgi:hypothetical protein
LFFFDEKKRRKSLEIPSAWTSLVPTKRNISGCSGKSWSRVRHEFNSCDLQQTKSLCSNQLGFNGDLMVC